MWGGNIEPESAYTIWEAAEFQSGAQVGHVLRFLEVCGGRHAELVPEPQLLVPSQAGDPYGYDGWSYAAYLPDKRTVLLYFEAGTGGTVIRSLLPETVYSLRWFDPRAGNWLVDTGSIVTDQTGRSDLPGRPSDQDWAAVLSVIPKSPPASA